MKVGDYVRTKDGYIYKIEDGEEFYEDCVDVGIGTIPDVDGIWIDKEHFQYVDKREIVKLSSNIIDLIKVGDYVNGCYVTNRQASHNEGITIIPKRIGIIKCKAYFNQGNYNNCEFKWIEEKDIKSIVTREQFENMEYKIDK